MTHAIVDQEAAQAPHIDLSTFKPWERRAPFDRLAKPHEAAQAEVDRRDAAMVAPPLPWRNQLAEVREYPIVMLEENASRTRQIR